MNILNIFKKYWHFLVSILLIILLIPLFSESFSKALTIVIFIVIWNLLGILLKDFVKSSVILLFLALPFNITYQVPYSINGFQIVDPFVNGVIVNYLIPTISILDLTLVLLLLSMFLEKRISLGWKGFSFLKIFTIFGVYLIFQSVFKGGVLALLNSFRLLLYIFTFYNLFKKKKEFLNQKFLQYLLFGSVFLILIQAVIALLQFSGGTSLGLMFLGESHVVSGMNGSSFLELKDALYLRGYGTFPHPNVLAGWLVFNTLFGWYLFNNLNKRRDASIFLMFLSSIVLILTFSRISFLICLIIWIAFLVKIFVKAKNKEFLFFGLVSERVLNLFTGGDTSWSDRIGLFKASFKVIKENLLIGTGLGRFIANMGEVVPRTSNGILLLQPVHNIFLLIFSEIGLFGTALFSTLFYFFFKDRKWSLRLIVALTAVFIIGIFDHYLVSLPQGLVLLFLIIVL